LKWAIYNLLFAAAYPLLLPGFLRRMLRRGGYAARFLDRFAIYPRELIAEVLPDGRPACPHGAPDHYPLTTNNYVWIHAVSVGEVQVAGQLMREWRKVEPGVRFVFSTTSSTGWKMAEREVRQTGKVKDEGEGERRRIDSGDVLIYNPLDFPSFVKSALKLFRPRAIILTESELWPNFILKAKHYGIPLFLINARVSDRSAPRYKAMRFLFKDVLGAFTKIFAQSDLDRDRLVAAGAPTDKVAVTGSFKFDVAHRNEAKEIELWAWIDTVMSALAAPSAEDAPKTPSDEKYDILLGGSTWPGEDELMLRAYRKSLDATPEGERAKKLLVIAPRHFEKADAVEANIRAAGFECIRRSRGDTAEAVKSRDLPPVFLADTTGELMGLYGIARVVFVGKSVCEHGSQNMIEPCLCGKPTVVGPNTENFRPVMSDLLAADAIIQTKDAAETGTALVKLMTEGDAELAKRASAAVERRRGVVPRCVTEIRGAVG